MSTFDYILLGLVTGLAIGSAGGYYFYRRLRTSLTELHAISENISALRTLRKLQAGDTAAAIKLNETALDLSVMTLGSLLREVPKARRDPNVLVHIRAAKEYREKYPHRSDTEGFDWQVAQYLAYAD
jgi:hypothetical protein